MEEEGGYDVCVCDSVLNSVNSKLAYMDVIHTCIALMKEDGILFISGRLISTSTEIKKSGGRGRLYFLDKDGFSATMRGQMWYFQKYDTVEELQRIFSEKFNSVKIDNCGNVFKIICSGVKGHISKQDIIESAMREWDMPLERSRYGLQDIIKNALLKKYQI